MWNDKFELPDKSYSVSDIPDYFQYIIKKHEAVIDNPPIRIYVIEMENTVTFKIKDEKRLEQWNRFLEALKVR